MSQIDVRFGMRIKERISLDDLAARIGKVLNCTFGQSDDRRDAWDVRVAEVLCLRLMITYWPQDDAWEEGREYTFTLSGMTIELRPWESISRINLTDWLLAKLQLLDSAEWYLPSVEELRAEVLKTDTSKT